MRQSSGSEPSARAAALMTWGAVEARELVSQDFIAFTNIFPNVGHQRSECLSHRPEERLDNSMRSRTSFLVTLSHEARYYDFHIYH